MHPKWRSNGFMWVLIASLCVWFIGADTYLHNSTDHTFHSAVKCSNTIPCLPPRLFISSLSLRTLMAIWFNG
ncbi:hypothetical protein C8F04DRAFT_660642 [Mycena alexandri]|uniref:Secreted protein n=1 Tax=Mycena alexandri TaxID=1745969 RepID=A0AAD6RVD8_9AGAR|nr:hypothetical protein C8F04DRAFT_660642 [Mycena alexandri]